MEVVDVLSHDEDASVSPLSLKAGERLVGRIGGDRRIQELSASIIVEALDEFGISRESLGRGHILEPVVFPEPVAAAEGSDAGLRGDSCARQDDDIHQLAPFSVLGGAADRGNRSLCISIGTDSLCPIYVSL